MLNGQKMHYWKQKTQSLTPQRWQSRQEILKSQLDSIPPDELRRVRPAYYWLCYGHEAWKRANATKANFNPNQLRDEQGRWVDSIDSQPRASESVGNAVNDTALESFAAASRRGRSAAFCLAQYAIDSLLCNSVKPASRARACWAQAAERLGNCINGRPIPPLNY